MYCACVHAENNITRLTKSFFSSDRRAHTRQQTHTLHHSGRHVFCTACHYRSLDVVTGWHWGLLLSFLWQLSLSCSTIPPSSPPHPCFSFSLPHVFPDPPSFHSIPPPSCLPPRPNPHPFLLLLQWDACLFLVCKPSWHTSPGQRADIGVFFGRRRGGVGGDADNLVSICRGTIWVDGAHPSVVPSFVDCGWQLLFLVFWIIGLVTAVWHPTMTRWWVCSACVYMSRPVL